MIQNHILFFCCWVLFYTLHSILSADKVKEKQPFSPKVYRLIYSLFSTVTLGFILILGASIYSGFVLPPSQVTFSIGLLTASFGFFVIKRAFRNYSFKSFLGLKKEDKENTDLKIDKLQGKMRHPLYTGTILIFFGYFIYNPLLVNLISLVALLIYLPIGIYLEEKKLIQTYGKAYIKYKEEVPALIPKINLF
ncbi:MAG: protein-S-isoprenylcysteine O-methyltransferase Ste14 [Candidatus Endobugula sp.]|jgi:protein-S-isoprenylcysteine O-methyltransferase Ste14